MKKIFIRSPYFIEVDEMGQTSAKIEVFLWNKGTTEPTTPNYTFTKNVPSLTQTKLSWNISNLAKSFIKPIAPVNVLVPTEESVNTWCYMKVKRYSDNVLLDTETFVCLNGYTQYLSGYNQINEDTVIGLSGNQKIYYNTISGYYLNVWIEPDPVEFDTIAEWYNGSTLIDTSTIVVAEEDASMYKVPIRTNTTELRIIQEDVRKNVFFEKLCEPKYTPIICTYINRFGGWQYLTFFKASMESIETDYKEFNMLPSSVNYNALQGQKRRFNHQSKQSIKCNTGWVDENYFELIQDLLLSETVLLGGKPAVVKSKSSEKKTHLKDKNINYEIEFEYNFGLINDVI